MFCKNCDEGIKNPFSLIVGDVRKGIFCSRDCATDFLDLAARAARFAAEGLELIPGENPDRRERILDGIYWTKIETTEEQTWRDAYNSIQDLNAVYSQVLQYKRIPTILKKRFEAVKLVHFSACRRAHVTSKWVGNDEFDRLFLRDQPSSDGGALASYTPKTTDEIPF